MAGLRTRRNPPLGGKNEFAGAPNKRNSTPVVFCAPIPAPAQAPASTSAPASAPGLLGRYMDKNLQRATKLALELFVKGQGHGQLQANAAPHEQPLKAWFPNLYYGNSHLDCYCFCQQCEDHFKTARDNGPNWVLFAALFLCKAMVKR